MIMLTCIYFIFTVCIFLQICSFTFRLNVLLYFISFSFFIMAAVEFIKDLCTPALVIDLDTVKRNAEGMQERFHSLGVQLRPHMKTHKTL